MKRTAWAFISMWVVLLIQAPFVYCQSKAASEEWVQHNAGVGPAVHPLDIVLVLDNSGSMKKNDPEFLTREVVTNFINGLGAQSRLGMVIFDQDARLAESLTELATLEARGRLQKNLDKINYKGQLTNSPAGIERAIYELKTNARKEAQKIIIFLTDGIVETGNKASDLEKENWLKEDLALESKQEGIRIFGVAFTDRADFRLIQTLALKTEGEYFRAYNIEDIQDVFSKINAVITTLPSKPEVAVAPLDKQAQPPAALRQPEPATPPTPSPEKALSLTVIIGGTIAFLALLLIFFIFKGRPKPATVEMRPAAQVPREEASIPRAQLIDPLKILFDMPLELTKRSMTIGRDDSNDIVIDKGTISSLHATIEYKEGYFLIEDQRSSNGTSLNDRLIESNKAIRLKSGDRIKFDVHECTFFIPGQATAGKTVLAGGASAAQPVSGTGLRSSTAQEPMPGPDMSVKEDKTRLKSVMCPNHPSWKATELCIVCKQAFCKQCMAEKSGQAVCLICTSKNHLT
jgi:hypothetical protein